MSEHMTTMMYKLPCSLKEALYDQAELERISASELVRKAVKIYLESIKVNAANELSKAS
jgi:hypothetical protein